jgi:hypothetical protein
MAYFNHAFQKVFVGTAGIRAAGTTAALLPLEYGLYVADTFAPYTVGSKTPFILASGSFYANDKIGPFHGGYKESNKSKVINPKYINGFYKVVDKVSTQALTIIGKTDNAATSACHNPTFSCNETYNLRIDVKGSPALRFLSHELYKTIDAYTGCCPTTIVAPATALVTTVDPVTVMIQWARAILADPFLSQFIQPVVKYKLTAGAGAFTTLANEAAFAGYTPQTTTATIAPIQSGIELLGAYVDTVFGDCSFSPMDHFEKEPIQIYASFVDSVGDPCLFTSICSTRAVLGTQGEGYGETVLRDLILSESYAQNYFNDDPRIRQITQGDNTLASINRAGKYISYYILHSVPRFNNPSGTFDNDQYLLKLVIDSTDTATSFETIIGAALTAVQNPVSLKTL